MDKLLGELKSNLRLGFRVLFLRSPEKKNLDGRQIIQTLDIMLPNLTPFVVIIPSL